MDLLKTAPARFVLLLTSTWLAIFLLTRGILLLTHLDDCLLYTSPSPRD